MRGLLVIVSLAVIGCGPTLNVRGQLARRARVDMDCAAVTQVLQLAEDAFEVDGCGRMVEYTDVAEGGARHWIRLVPAARVASEELRCPLEILELGEGALADRRTFLGCGASATYALRCVEGQGCSWAREGEITWTRPPMPMTPPTIDAPLPPPPEGT